MLQHAVVVKLSEVLDFSDATLEKPEVVHLEAETDGLNHVVDNLDHEVGVVAMEGA